eukprot:gene16060-biopygen4490
MSRGGCSRTKSSWNRSWRSLRAGLAASIPADSGREHSPRDMSYGGIDEYWHKCLAGVARTRQGVLVPTSSVGGGVHRDIGEIWFGGGAPNHISMHSSPVLQPSDTATNSLRF